jgi:hypothetical protein
MSTPEPRQSLTTFAVSAALVVLGLVAIGPAYLNHDAAWYLYVADRWIGGATLYRDLVDTNPPLIIWLTAIPALIARITGAPGTLLLKAAVCALAITSVLAVRHIIVRQWPSREFALVVLASFLTVPFAKEDFAQREHVVILLCLPYILAAGSGAPMPSTALRILVGIVGGVGFAIKPHFLITLIAVEFLTMRARGPRGLGRVESLAATGTLIVYGIAVVLLTPAYLGVADQVRRVYGEFNASAGTLLRLREAQLWIVAAALFAGIRWRSGDYLPHATFGAATGFLAAAVLQFKGWGYHLYPGRVFVVLFLAIAVLAVLERVPGVVAILRGGLRGVATVFAVTLLAVSARYVAEARSPATPDLVTPMIDSFKAAPADSPVAVLSMRTIIYPAFPSVNYSGRRWGLRENSLLFLPGFYGDQDRLQGGVLTAHAPGEMSRLEREYFDQIIEDLCSAPPGVLAFEEPAQKAAAGRRALDLQAYYAQDARAAALFSSYHPSRVVGPFRLMVRTGEAGCR